MRKKRVSPFSYFRKTGKRIEVSFKNVVGMPFFNALNVSRETLKNQKNSWECFM